MRVGPSRRTVLHGGHMDCSSWPGLATPSSVPDLGPKGRDVALDEKLATTLLESSRVTSDQLGDAQKVMARDKMSLGAALIRLGALLG